MRGTIGLPSSRLSRRAQYAGFQLVQNIPSATYRIQMREGVTFSSVEQQLGYLVDLGISHLYLSPIFAAAEGSTHGYDIIDPTVIEPALGGSEGFEKLARAAHEVGLGVILDIVPNHTAFTPENPWLQDVLRRGPDSPFAAYFDIDWTAGPLVLPFLPEPFEVMLSRGDFCVRDGKWCFGPTEIPLAAGHEKYSGDVNGLAALHEMQHWRLRHWELERDGITHRRFFNITSLIGMRIEVPEVFEATHKGVVELVEAGLVDGLRIDHVDGLADPKAYLDQLASVLPGTPVWVEKILTGAERLDPQWKTVGTTGYEAAGLITQLLTDGAGLEAIDLHWRAYTGISADFPASLEAAKLDILSNELAAELHQLSMMARACLTNDPNVEPGPEGLREAVTQLLLGMPRYRTYLDGSPATADARDILDRIVALASARIRSTRIVERLVQHLIEPAGEADRTFARRFQQVSGALLAKAQEDTAGFRWTRYLAENEVGAEPENPTIIDEDASSFLASRRASEMSLTSSHDTKRSEDSRARLIAISHAPEAFWSLVEAADPLAPEMLSHRWRWYIVQSALALWGTEVETIKQRLRQHNQKAMREAKLESFWTRPDPEAEAAADGFSDRLCDQWKETEPAALQQLVETGEALSLAQLALKCLMPGFPDIYRGAEGPFFALTDPDNRLPFDRAALAAIEEADGFGAEKLRLTRVLLALRQEEALFFQNATAEVHQESGTILRRVWGERNLTVTIGSAATGASIWRGTGKLALNIAWV
jgi:(1->4)-alpha-D-glucan 1-alpha-D-glucosylmutase